MIALARLGPGLALATAVGAAALALEPVVKLASAGTLALPAMVLALVVGIALNGLAVRATFEPGLTFAVKRVLRWAIALLGLRVALSDIWALGLGTIALVVFAMMATLASGVFLARRLGLSDGYGALAGAATAVCGASATLATATVVPAYKGKEADVAFTVVAANAVSTLVMLAYPALARAIGLDAVDTGVFLGATIHDMAQVVGAGYAVSEPVGNSAVVVKLFRVFLLLPVVLIVGWWFVSRGEGGGRASVPVPVFALVFLVLVGVNSVLPGVPGLAEAYGMVRGWLVMASNAGLLLAIAALGLGTSLSAVLSIGWRHAAAFLGATGVLLAIVVAGVMAT